MPRYPGEPQITRKNYQDMTYREKLSFYDSHNGTMRFSNDLNQRLFGACGCQFCAETRATWAVNPAPIDDQRRKGSRSMSSINVCDRCGGLVTGIALGSVTVRTSADPNNTETVHKETCPHCVATVVMWLETPAEPQQKTPYREAWRRPPDEQEEKESDDAVRKLVRTVMEEVSSVKAIEGQATQAGDDPDCVVRR